MPVSTLTRVFRIGSVSLPDPDPSMEPEDVIRFYEPNHAALSGAQIGESFVEGDALVFPIQKPTVKTKG